jgi:hypothetical protein
MLNGIRRGTLTTVPFRLLYLYRLVQTQSIGTPDSKLVAILIEEGWDLIFSVWINLLCLLCNHLNYAHLVNVL